MNGIIELTDKRIGVIPIMGSVKNRAKNVRNRVLYNVIFKVIFKSPILFKGKEGYCTNYLI